MSKKILSIICLLCISFSIAYADVDDNSSDLNELRTKIGDVQGTQAGLPSGVPEPKGKIGFILSRMFNSNGQISNAVLKSFNGTTRTNNNFLKWSGGNGGSFAQSLLYDDGSTVGVGGLPDTATLELDVAGAVGATQYCDGSGNNCFDPASVALESGTIGGGGTNGYTARFTGTGFTLGDGVIRDNGSTVGIGVAAGGDRLRVNGVARIDGGVTVDGRAAISGTNASHTARYIDDSHYGYFEVRNNSNSRGAYFGFGNGGNQVQINADAANQFLIDGGVAGTELLNVDGGASFDTGITNTDFTIFDTDKGTVSNVFWYDYSSGITYLGNTGGAGANAEVQIRGKGQLDVEGTAANHLVTKGYIDTQIASGGVWTLSGSDIYRNTGNVGIGTTIPSAGLKLDVEGKVGATEYCDSAGLNCFTPGGASIGGIDDLSDGKKVSSSTFLGTASGDADDGTDNQNTAVGDRAIESTTTGVRNTALGRYALRFNTTGNNNIALGAQALYVNTTGAQNTAIGSYTLDANSTGTYNDAIGYLALSENTTGHRNTALGGLALRNATTANNNVAVGYNALNDNITGTQNTAVGTYSLDVSSADGNTAVGYSSLGVATTGSNNTAVGRYSLDALTTGLQNTGIGYDALGVLTTGANNVGLGDNAGDNITTGSNNVVIGADIDAPSATENNQININNLIYGRDGNVGIGINNPATKLHITGGSDTELGSGGYLVLGDTTGTNISIDNNEILARNNGAPATLHIQASSTTGNTSLNSAGGNVGIGTGSPRAKLDVRGQVEIDQGGTYDVWIQGEGTTGTVPRNLAMLGVKGTDALYVNYFGEYSGGTWIGGNAQNSFGVGNTLVTGNYGSVQTYGGGKAGWEGYSINGRMVFMHDGGSAGGIYNDVNNHWMFYGINNGETRMYHAGTWRWRTHANGVQMNGATQIDNVTCIGNCF